MCRNDTRKESAINLPSGFVSFKLEEFCHKIIVLFFREEKAAEHISILESHLQSHLKNKDIVITCPDLTESKFILA